MTTHEITAFDSHHAVYNNRTYVRTMYSSTTNQLFHPHLTTLPIPSVNLCDLLLYETKIAEDVGSATSSSSSYVDSNEHYDNTCTHTYDNPIECLENYNIKQSLMNLPQGTGNLYDNTIDVGINDDEKCCSSGISHSTSPILFYLENKRLALYACIISLLLLIIIGIGIFLLNKFIRPPIITPNITDHYDAINMSNISAIPISSQSTLIRLLTQSSTHIPITIDDSPFSYSMCPPDRWGIGCKNVCKPCGLGVCHPITGKCICPEAIYGEFCDLWKVNDKPKRGDMMS